MNKTQEALAYKAQMESLSTQIDELLEQIEEATLAQTALAEQAGQSAKEIAAQSADLEKLRAQQKELIDELAKETKEEAELRIVHNKESQEMEAELEVERRAAEKELEEMTRELDQTLAISDQYILTREETLAQKNQTSESAQTLQEKHNASHKILQDELEQISQQLKEALKAAAIRRSVSHIEKESAENAVMLAQKALDETNTALEEAEALLIQRKQQLEITEQDQGAELQEIRQAAEELIAEARVEEQQASKAFIAKKQELSKAQSMVDLAVKTLATAEDNKRRMSQELQGLYQQAEKEAEQINSDMEEALRRTVAERARYSKALTLAEQIQAEADQIADEESKYEDLVSRLNIEVHDLRNAALVAQNLVTDATMAKGNSDPDMANVLLEMERALAIAAGETQTTLKQKELELAEAEEALNTLAGNSHQKQQAATTANNLLREAEKRCLLAEQTMYDLSVQAESRSKSRLGQLIASKRSFYEQSMRESNQLKNAASNAENNLRTIKNEVNKAERAMTVSARNAAQIISTSEKTIAEAEQRFDNLISEARALMEIAADKREKLYTARTAKQMDLEQSKDQLELKIQVEEQAISTLEALNSNAQVQIQKLKDHLEEAIQRDQMAYEEAKNLADAAAERHEQALRESISTSEAIIRYQEQIKNAKESTKKLLENQQNKRQAAQNLAEYQEKEKSAICHNLERRLANLSAPINLAELNLNKAQKGHACLRAALSAKELRLELLNGELTKAIRQREQLQAAEDLRLAREAEEQRLEAVRAAELQAKKEEEERQKQLKEQARVTRELEAAHIAAEGERARLAAAQYRAQEAANEEAILLAAGKFLTPEDNLRIINSGELSARIQAMSELARAEVNRQNVRWLTLDEAANLVSSAKQARMGAELQETMFNAIQTTYNGICSELTDRWAERKKAGQNWAGALVAGYRVERQKLALDKTIAGTQEVASCMDDETRKAFTPFVEQLKHVQLENENLAIQAETQLKEALASIDQAEQNIAASSQAEKEARDLLNDIANKWIYSAYEAVRLEAEVEVMHCETADRNEIAALAQQRFEAAKKAAEAASDREERIGSVEKLANKRKKKKKKKA